MTHTLIASANTSRGYAIGIVHTTHAGRSGFEVVRLDPRSRYITISVHTDEPSARTRANTEWRADTAAAR